MVSDLFDLILPLAPGAIRTTAAVMLSVVPVACDSGLIRDEPRAPQAAAMPEGPWIRHTIDSASRGADGVRLADVNGDGLPDITTGWEEGGRIRVCLNPGPAQAADPWPAFTVGNVGAPEDAVFVDVDADGRIDVVSCCEGGVKRIHVHWAPSAEAAYDQPGDWRTEVLPAADGLTRWMFALPMQVDGQHGVDLVAGAKSGGAKVGWFEAPDDPRDLASWTWHPIHDAGWIMSIVAEDVDADGDDDLVVSDRKGDNRGCLWLENPGPGSAQRSAWTAHPIGATGEEVMFLTVTDLDDDGLTDVLTAVRGRRLIYQRRVDDDPPRWADHTITIPAGTGTTKAVAVGDVDADGRRDIVVTCENASDAIGVFWLSCRGEVADTTWDLHDISGTEGVKYDLVELLDLDADGDLDVLTCEESRNLGVIWYENPLR